MFLHLVENSLINYEELKIKSIIDDMNLIKVQALLTLVVTTYGKAVGTNRNREQSWKVYFEIFEMVLISA